MSSVTPTPTSSRKNRKLGPSLRSEVFDIKSQTIQDLIPYPGNKVYKTAAYVYSYGKYLPEPPVPRTGTVPGISTYAYSTFLYWMLLFSFQKSINIWIHLGTCTQIYTSGKRPVGALRPHGVVWRKHYKSNIFESRCMSGLNIHIRI